jgi:hypothetical protein
MLTSGDVPREGGWHTRDGCGQVTNLARPEHANPPGGKTERPSAIELRGLNNRISKSFTAFLANKAKSTEK